MIFILETKELEPKFQEEELRGIEINEEHLINEEGFSLLTILTAFEGRTTVAVETKDLELLCKVILKKIEKNK